MKRTLDLAAAMCSLMLLSPVLLFIALAIRLDSPGPVLFRQKRLGKNGTPFTLYKVRTMYVGAPEIRHPDGSAHCADHDPRVTGAGRWLRRTSLDELPQLWNVLIGDMSLVGPRPDQVDQLQYYTEDERRKLLVKPGITGLAQISGRNAISWEQRKRLDVEYVQRQSLGLDLAILLRTIPQVLLQRDVVVSSERNEPC